MGKGSEELDLDDWVDILDDVFQDFQHPEDGGKWFSTREIGFDSRGEVDMDHFKRPSLASRVTYETQENSSVSQDANQLVPGNTPDHEVVKGMAEVPIVDVNIVTPAISEDISRNLGAVPVDQDMISPIFFKQMKKNEFVDMIMDSPKLGIKTQTEVGSIQLGEKEEAYTGEAMEHKASSKAAIEQVMVKKNNYMQDSKIKGESRWEGCEGGICIWKWKISGTGALCSIGVAAATICIFILGGHSRHKHHHQNQKLQFQVYADHKGIKHMVNHATRLNQAVTSVRGVPLTSRANISFGGYYDGL